MSAPVYFLHPQGDDRHDGRAARPARHRQGPWVTLTGARDHLRRLRSTGKIAGPVTVRMAGGIYPVTEPITLGPADSHTTYAAAPRAVPVLDGGTRLAGWREERVHGHRAWVLDLPEVAQGRWNFRTLFVNGVRRPRARLPKFSLDPDGAGRVFRIGALRFPERRGFMDGDHAFAPRPGDIQAWPSLAEADIVLLHYWVDSRLGSARFDPATGLLHCARRSVFNLYESFRPRLARYYVDNLGEALTAPGEWYLDRSRGRLTYLPLPGETQRATRVIAPRVESFLNVTGDTASGDAVEALHFEGITFRHGDWSSPPVPPAASGAAPFTEVPLAGAGQAAMHIPAALSFRHARRCHLVRCRWEHVGLHGVEWGPGCTQCRITRSYFMDIGGGGIRVHGGTREEGAARWTSHIAIEDNTLTDIGRVFHQSVGILIGHAFACTVAHNEVAYTRYTGISVGWTWGFDDSISRDHRIEFNHIHHIGQGLLSDLGGIYLLGVQPGTVVRGNHIHDVTAADYGGWGIYPDEGSSHILIEGNWVHDTQGSPFRIHFARELVVRHNVFAGSRDEGIVGIGRVGEGIAATLTHNLLLGPAPFLFEGGYAGDVRRAFHSDANLIWFPDGRMTSSAHPPHRRDVPRRISWTAWQAAGLDRQSVVADPRVTIKGRNLVFARNSPALRLGFQPHDWSRCGPRPLR